MDSDFSCICLLFLQVRSFYVWIACQRAENYSMDSIPSNNSPLYKLLLARAGRYSYNVLFSELCQCVGIPCIIVRGAVKGTGYQHGQKPVTTNSWCLVYVDGFWGFIDQHWGSTYVSGGTKKQWTMDVTDLDDFKQEEEEETQHYGMDEDYFLPDPYQFIYDHFCENREHQLLPRPVTTDEFRLMARLRNTYFHKNIVDLSEPKCVLSTDTGELKLHFDLKEDSYLKFNFVLYKSYGAKTHPEGEVNLQNYLFILNGGNRRTICMEFEYIGTYQLELMVTDVKNNPNTRYVLGSYVIKCTRPKFDYDPPILSNTEPELGPGADWKLLHITTQQQSGILDAKDGKIHLNMLHDNTDDMEYYFELFGKQGKDALRRAALYQRAPESTKLHVRLPSHGKYLLKINTKEKGTKLFRNTCNYVVTSDEACVEAPFHPNPQLRALIGQVGQQRDLEAVSHPDALFTVEGATKPLRITMKKLVDVDVVAKLELHTDEETKDLSEYILAQERDQQVEILLHFPHHGMYDVAILTKPHGSSLEKSWHYVIDVVLPSPECLAFPKKCTEDLPSKILLHSPLQGVLKETTGVDFDVEVPGRLKTDLTF